jgi:hypothetical protein
VDHHTTIHQLGPLRRAAGAGLSPPLELPALSRRTLMILQPARSPDLCHHQLAQPSTTHQGIAQRVPGDERDSHRATVTDVDIQQIRRKPVLHGLINEYAHAA